MSKRGVLIVLSGFSGSGKGTIVNRLLADYNSYALSISATTRLPRVGEQEGVSYFYKTKDEFKKMIGENEFIEYARYVDNYYGTPKAYVNRKLEEGKDVILEIEIQGALKVKEQFPETVLLFVTPPDADTLKKRLIGRGTETEEVVSCRLARAAKEAEGMEKYDYLIINDDLDACVKEAHQVIQSEHFKVDRNKDLIENIRKDVKRFSEGE